MSGNSLEYNPVVGIPETPLPNTKRAEEEDLIRRTTKSLLLVAPFYYFLVDPLLQWQMIPSTATKLAISWRRLLGNRPLKRWSRSVLHDITGAHMLLSLPLVFLFIRATDIALLHPNMHHALKTTGTLTSVAMLFVFLTSHKSHSLVSLVTGLSFDRLLVFHMAGALLALWMALLHGVQIAYYHKGEQHDDHDHDEHDHDDHHDDHDGHDDHDHEHRRLHHHASIHAYLGSDPSMSKFFLDGSMNFTGFSVLVTLLAMIVTSLFRNPIRKRFFEFWMIYHIVGAAIILVMGILHGADLFWWALVLWVLDWAIRYGMMVGIYPKQARVTRIAQTVTKVEWPKTDNFHYEPGQFVKVCIPDLSFWEFHPFSISSTPDDPFVTLYVRALPDPQSWSRQLYDELAEPHDDNKISTNSVRVLLEGSYGSLPPILEHRNQHKYSMAVFISGGIGATPCHSIAKSLIEGSAASRPSLKKVRYIWTLRNDDLISALPPPVIASTEPLSTEKGGDFELVEHRPQESGQSSLDDSDSSDCQEDPMFEHGGASTPSLAVQTDIYVSQMEQFLDSYDDEEVQKEAAKAKHKEEDAKLPYNIHRGHRPDVHALLEQIHAEAAKNGWGRVFVMVCGPMSLLEACEVACQRNETDAVQLDFHQEIFEY